MRCHANLPAVCALTIALLGSSVSFADPQSLSAKPPRAAGALIRVGHDSIMVDPALKRYAGVVTAIGAADSEGRIYSFTAARLPAAPGYAVNELQGWRLTVLAGQRFSNVFEVASNTEAEITVTARDGPLNGLAVRDVFVIELIAADRQEPSSDQPESKPGS